MKDQIIKGMAKAFFASAYADQAKECGKTLRGEIMDQLPEVIDPASLHAARTLCMGMEAKPYLVTRPSLDSIDVIKRLDIGSIYRLAVAKQLFAQDKGDRELTPELFGHYCAMQAIGHGVGLDSFGQVVCDAIKVPYIEFGSYSLEKDYFTDGINEDH